MAIDYGTARIGVAVSDRTLTISANSVTVKSDGRAVDAVAEICKAEEITNVVIGLPLNREGGEGDMCKAAREFGEKLENKFEYGELRVEFFDERMTTRASNSILIEANMSRKKRKSVVDGLAAKIILQKFLDDLNLKIKKQ